MLQRRVNDDDRQCADFERRRWFEFFRARCNLIFKALRIDDGSLPKSRSIESPLLLSGWCHILISEFYDYKFVANFLRLEESRRSLYKNKLVDANGKESRGGTNHNSLVFPGLRMRVYSSLSSARTISSERCESVVLIEIRCAVFFAGRNRP